MKQHLHLQWRILQRPSFLLLVLTVLVGASLTTWRLTQASLASQAPARVIDWQHPVPVPGPGMALAGVGSPSTGDIFTLSGIGF